MEVKNARRNVVRWLVMLSSQRILHELCCGREAGIVPLPNFVKKLKEQERWMACRRAAPLNMDDALRGYVNNSPMMLPEVPNNQSMMRIVTERRKSH